MRTSNLTAALRFFIYTPVGPVPGASPLTFNGHIDNITDNMAPQWDAVQQAGRPDPKRLYSQFSRSITVSFYIIAENDGEHLLNKTKLETLSKSTYPFIAPGQGYNGNYIRIKLKNTINAYGIMTQLSYNWTNEYVWKQGVPIITSVNATMEVIGDKSGKRPSALTNTHFI